MCAYDEKGELVYLRVGECIDAAVEAWARLISWQKGTLADLGYNNTRELTWTSRFWLSGWGANTVFSSDTYFSVWKLWGNLKQTPRKDESLVQKFNFDSPAPHWNTKLCRSIFIWCSSYGMRHDVKLFLTSNFGSLHVNDLVLKCLFPWECTGCTSTGHTLSLNLCYR